MRCGLVSGGSLEWIDIPAKAEATLPYRWLVIGRAPATDVLNVGVPAPLR